MKASQDIAFADLHQEVKKVVSESLLEGQKRDESIKQEIASHADTQERLIKLWINEEFRAHERHRNRLESFAFPEMWMRQQSIEDAHKATYEWIFDPSADLRPWADFHEWLTCGTGIYWMNGKPGAGKSTLMKFALEHHKTKEALARWAPSHDVLTPAFFFWSPGNHNQKSHWGLLKALICQTLDRREDMYQFVPTNDGSKGHNWSEGQLLNMFDEILRQEKVPLKLCFFIDGLDECSNTWAVLSLIERIESSRNAKCVVSSRPSWEFVTRFEDSPKLRLQDLTKEDLTLVITNTFKEQIFDVLTESEKKRLESEMSTRAQGVFLWVRLVTRALINGRLQRNDKYAGLSKRVAESPKEMDELYIAMLDSIEPQYRVEASRYFQLLLILGRGRASHGVDHFSLVDFAFTDLGLDDEDLCPVSQLNAIDQEEIVKRGKLISERIQQRCGGLLQLELPPDPDRYKNYLADDWFHVCEEKHDKTLTSAYHICNVTRIDFVHRTAYDFIKSHSGLCQSMSADSESEWMPAVAQAKSILAKHAWLGTLNDCPVLWERPEVLRALQSLARIENVTSISQILLLRRLEDQLSSRAKELLDPHHFSWPALFKDAEEPYENPDPAALLGPARNLLGVCAVFKMHATVREQLPTTTKEQRTNLVYCIVYAIKRRAQRDVAGHEEEGHADLARRADVLKLILERGADVNDAQETTWPTWCNSEMVLSGTLITTKADIESLTAWTSILSLLLPDLSSARRPIWNGLLEDPASISEKHLLIVVADLLDAVVHAGADLNINLTTSHYVRLEHGKEPQTDTEEMDILWLVEASPLGLIKNHFRNQSWAKELIKNMIAKNAPDIFCSSKLKIRALIRGERGARHRT